MDIDVEKLNELIDKKKIQLKKRFFQDTNVEELHIALYHGTDQFVLDLSEEERLRYYDALQTYLEIAKREITIIPEKLEGNQERNALMWRFGSVKLEARNFEYGILYTTTDLKRKIVDYSNNARFFGEIGDIVYCLRRYVKRNQITINIDPETENVLADLYSRIESNMESRPVYLKTYRVDKVVADENGAPLNMETFIRRAQSHCTGDFKVLPCSYRMSADLSLRDFEIIDYEKEKELLRENKIRVDRMQQKYIEDELKKIFDQAELALKNSLKEIGTADESLKKELVIKSFYEQFEKI